ncbi:MAG TPA: hypothetical protein VNU26_06340, partial [Mycobacteriales bacterium]|nr:hypothetical protein [Mycobacteriales bacterium]
VQGYAISKPLSAEQVPQWLEARVRDLAAFDERWVAAALASAAESGLLELPRVAPPDAATA